MKQVPRFYQKNIARGAVKKTGTNPEQRREAVAQAVYWCMVIAMHEELRMGKETLEKFGAVMQTVVTSYENKINVVGRKQADAWLDEQTKELRFVLPAIRPIKKARDREELARKRQDADPVWKLCSVSLREMGYGTLRQQRWLDRAEEEYRWFGEWAKDGDLYGFERLRAALEQILRESMELVIQPGESPVFSNRIW